MGLVAFFIVVGTMAFSAAFLMAVCCVVNAHEENVRRQQVAERVLADRPLTEADEEAQQQERDGPADRDDDDDDGGGGGGKPGTSEYPTYNIRTGAREGVVYSRSVA